MVDITDSTTVVAVENTLITTLDGESVLLHTDSGKYFGFNEVGTEIWEMIQEPQSVETLSYEMVDKYDIDHETVRADVEALLTELIDKGLVKVIKE